MPTFPHLPGLTQQDGMLWVQRIPASLDCSIFFGLLTFFPKLLYSSLFVHSLASVWDALNALSSHKENQSPTVVKEVKTDFDHKLLPQGNWVQFYSEVCFPLCSSCWINSCSYFLNHRPVLVIFNNPYRYVSVSYSSFKIQVKTHSCLPTLHPPPDEAATEVHAEVSAVVSRTVYLFWYVHLTLLRKVSFNSGKK